jgi:hypothetical protein
MCSGPSWTSLRPLHIEVERAAEVVVGAEVWVAKAAKAAEVRRSALPRPRLVLALGNRGQVKRRVHARTHVYPPPTHTHTHTHTHKVLSRT